MTEEKRVLAFDFGASSGRAVIGRFDGRSIHMEEVHRFANDPVMVRGRCIGISCVCSMRSSRG